ncbi:MAG: FtsX-like permease family protein [Planctomycetes bacterium]|nr:FtsX-like permease family protein [Planctomycetota bacterium]
MKLLELLRYAWSDLSHRKLTTALNVGAVCLACVYILVLGFYGASIHGYQSDLLARSMQTRIVAVAQDATDASLLFTDASMAELAAQPGVQAVFPRVEINAQVMLDPSRIETTRAVGTAPDDPELAAGRLAWGRAIADDGGREAVLPLRFFEKLGGRLDPREGPVPARLVLEVGRTTSTGLEQRESLELAVAGLLEHQEEERVHVPVPLVRELLLWCGSYRATLFDDDEQRVRFPAVDAWVARDDLPLVEGELRLQQVEAQAGDELLVPDVDGPRWAALVDAEGEAAEPPAWLVPGGEALAVREVLVTELDGVRVLVLPDDDPRWTTARDGSDHGVGETAVPGSVHDTDVAGRVFALTAAGRAFAAARDVVSGALDETSAVGACDLLADPAGWRRLAFVPEESDGVQPYCWVTSSDLHAGTILAGLRGAAPDATQMRGFAFLRAPLVDDAAGDGSSASLAPLVPSLEDLDLGHGAFSSALAEVPDALGVPQRTLPARRVPAAFLSDGLPRTPRAGGVTCALVSGLPGEAPDRLLVAGARVDTAFVFELPGAPDTVLLADDGESGASDGLVVWGAWDALLTGVARLADAGWELEPGLSNLPEEISVVVPGDVDALARRLGDAVLVASRVEPFAGIPARRADRPGEALVLAPASLFGGTGEGRVRLRAGDAKQITVEGAGWTLPARPADGFSDVPPQLLLLDDLDFRAAAWGSSTRAAAPRGDPRCDVLLADTLALRTAGASLAEAGLHLVPFSDDGPSRVLVEHRVTDPLSDDGRLDGTLARQLAMASPPFVECLPELEVSARLDGMSDDVVLHSSAPRDPGRFAHVPCAGTWLREGRGGNQVVLPRSVLGLADGDDGRALLGRAVTIVARRQLAGGPAEELRIPLRLVGLLDDGSGYAPLELLRDLVLWSEDRVVYHEAEGAFVAPADLVAGRGDRSCNVYVSDVAQVAPVVALLRARGYDTHDRLDEQRALQRLGRVLGFLVVFFALGCAANAAITVCVATMMNVKSKIWEIGILRAHGLRRGQVLSIFASQGACIGLLAFVLAVLVVLLVEPLVRSGVLGLFSLEGSELLQGSPFELRWWWVPASAFAAAVLFSVCGVLAPAWRACQMSPVDALKSRE